jgi:hypothetical protein
VKQPSEENREKDELALGWKDFVAICIAVYQLLLPRLLIMIVSVIVVAYLLLWLWG